MLPIKVKLFKRRRDNKIRYSADKIYTSRAELEHTNSKFNITLHTYNKLKSSIQHKLRKFVTLVKFRTTGVGEQERLIPYYKNRLLHLVKSKFFTRKK